MNKLELKEELVHDLADLIIEKLQDRISKIQSEPTPEYLTRNQLAKLLSVDLATVHRWSKEGKLPSYRLGGRIYFKSSDIDESMVRRNI